MITRLGLKKDYMIT